MCDMLYVHADTKELLKRLSSAHGVPMSRLVSLAIDNYSRERRETIPDPTQKMIPAILLDLYARKPCPKLRDAIQGVLEHMPR